MTSTDVRQLLAAHGVRPLDVEVGTRTASITVRLRTEGEARELHAMLTKAPVRLSIGGPGPYGSWAVTLMPTMKVKAG